MGHPWLVFLALSDRLVPWRAALLPGAEARLLVALTSAPKVRCGTVRLSVVSIRQEFTRIIARSKEIGSNRRMRTRWSGLTIDCANPVRLAAFWGALLDRDPEPGLPGWAQLGSRHDHEPRINFQPVPEPRRGKVRIHLDVTVDNLDEVIARVLDLGGSETGQRHDYPEGSVVVLKDPEGNEFCIVQYRWAEKCGLSNAEKSRQSPQPGPGPHIR